MNESASAAIQTVAKELTLQAIEETKQADALTMRSKHALGRAGFAAIGFAVMGLAIKFGVDAWPACVLGVVIVAPSGIVDILDQVRQMRLAGKRKSQDLKGLLLKSSERKMRIS